MNRGMRILMVVALGLLAGHAAWAEEGASSAGERDRVEDVMSRYNLQPAFEKLGRGVANTFGGVLEIPLGIEHRYSKSDVGGSFLTGAAIGAFKALVRTGVGMYETVTFFLPYPENYAPILPTLEYFKRDTRRQPLPLE